MLSFSNCIPDYSNLYFQAFLVLKAWHFLFAITATTLAYSRDSRRWGHLRYDTSSQRFPSNPISEFPSADLCKKNKTLIAATQLDSHAFLLWSKNFFLSYCPSTSFLLPVQLSFKNNGNVYFSHPFLRYSQCTVQIPVSIHGLIGKYYCRTCGLTVPSLTFDQSGCFACSNLAFTVISALNLPNKHQEKGYGRRGPMLSILLEV